MRSWALLRGSRANVAKAPGWASQRDGGALWAIVAARALAKLQNACNPQARQTRWAGNAARCGSEAGLVEHGAWRALQRGGCAFRAVVVGGAGHRREICCAFGEAQVAARAWEAILQPVHIEMGIKRPHRARLRKRALPTKEAHRAHIWDGSGSAAEAT